MGKIYIVLALLLSAASSAQMGIGTGIEYHYWIYDGAKLYTTYSPLEVPNFKADSITLGGVTRTTWPGGGSSGDSSATWTAGEFLNLEGYGGNYFGPSGATPVDPGHNTGSPTGASLFFTNLKNGAGDMLFNSASNFYFTADSGHVDLGGADLDSVGKATMVSIKADSSTITTSTFTALSTDSARADYYSTDGATSFLSMSGDTLIFAQTGAPGDRDIVQKWVEEDGSPHLIFWDDANNRFDLPPTKITSLVIVTHINVAGRVFMTYSADTAKLTSSSSCPTFLQDPNTSGAGTLKFGETGDGDTEYHNSYQRGVFVSVSADYTLGVAECMFLECTTNSTIKLPAAPSDGEYFYIKFTHASGGTLNGNGQNIDGAGSIVLSQYDAKLCVYNGTQWLLY